MTYQIDALLNQDFLGVLATIGIRVLVVAIILAVGWVAGRLIGHLVGRAMSQLGGDAILRKAAFGRTLSRSGLAPSDFAHALAKWIIYVTAFLFALDSLEIPYISVQVLLFLAFLPTLIGALIILIVGFTVSDWAGELVKKGFTDEQKAATYVGFIGEFVRVALYFVTITIALSRIGVDVTILHIFAQAFAWAFAIIIGVAAGIIIGWMLKDKVKEFLPASA